MMLAKALQGAATAAEKLYIESVFQTWLYTGNGSTQTITNGIDLSGEGGLVWIKSRSSGVEYHNLFDTARGAEYVLFSNATDASASSPTRLSSFNSTGFTVGSNAATNANSATFASWTFRKAAKFFDVVTYTGTSSAQTIAHSLGATPGAIIVKRTNTSGSNWYVYHRSLGTSQFLSLNATNAAANFSVFTSVTSTDFTLITDTDVNSSGNTYVAYLFAHDAGGFGDSGNDSVVKCGSFTTDSSGNATVDLGWEPQWCLFKNYAGTANWMIADVMRGSPVDGNGAFLQANTAVAEFDIGAGVGYMCPTPTGFQAKGFGGIFNLIYIAIRRGPMKTPTDATKVFAADAGTNGTSGGIVTTGFPVDMDMTAYRSLGGVANVEDRVRGYGNTNTAGATRGLLTSSTAAETTGSSPYFYNAWNTTITRGGNGANPGGAGIISWFFRRAPGFFDVVAYTGTSATLTVNHNLGVKPELIIFKNRSGSGNNWAVLCEYCTNGSVGASGRYLYLNTTSAETDASGNIFPSAPTSTTFTVSSAGIVNFGTMIAYLFASCPGVSKVGSYTGSASTLDIDCGFTNGSRFVLIKRTSSGGFGDWYVFDSARGIVSGNDPYLALNRTDAENFFGAVDAIDPYSAGFSLPGSTLINDPGASFIYLAIA